MNVFNKAKFKGRAIVNVIEIAGGFQASLTIDGRTGNIKDFILEGFAIKHAKSLLDRVINL